MADPREEKGRKTSEDSKKADSSSKKKNTRSDGDGDDPDSKGSGAVVALAGIIILLVWLAIIAIIVRMDVGGIGTMLSPYLRNIPVVNKILPQNKQTEKSSSENDPYAFSSMQEAVARVKQLEKENASLKKQVDAAATSSTDLAAAKKQLKKYQKNEKKFEQEKEDFYEKVVYSDKAPDISNYKSYYEEIEPENAEKIYKQVVSDLQSDKKMSDYAKTYSAMKPQEAADIFDKMTNNLKLVAKILNAMDTDSRGAVLGKMDKDTAAAVTKIMNPS